MERDQERPQNQGMIELLVYEPGTRYIIIYIYIIILTVIILTGVHPGENDAVYTEHGLEAVYTTLDGFSYRRCTVAVATSLVLAYPLLLHTYDAAC